MSVYNGAIHITPHFLLSNPVCSLLENKVIFCCHEAADKGAGHFATCRLRCAGCSGHGQILSKSRISKRKLVFQLFSSRKTRQCGFLKTLSVSRFQRCCNPGLISQTLLVGPGARNCHIVMGRLRLGKSWHLP